MDSEATKITRREHLCLEYLKTLMEAPADSIGRYIIYRYNPKGGGSNFSSVGANVACALRRRGLVVRNELGWRITQKGRHALAVADGV